MIDMVEILGLAAELEEEFLDNLLLPCMNARQGQAPKGSLLFHCSCCRDRRRKASLRHCSLSRGSVKVSPAVTSSHCSSMTV
jgi:hypothetical protein